MKRFILTLIIVLFSSNLVFANLILQKEANTRVKKTKEDIVLDVKQRITQLYSTATSQLRYIYNEIWFNQDATPEEIIGAFGSDGYALFASSDLLQQSIKIVNPNYVILSPDNYNVQADEQTGVVTLTKK